MEMRDYQQDIFEQIAAASSNDLVQLDTGAGKTPIAAALVRNADRSICVAHRNVLIKQLSRTLAAFDLEHDTVSTEHTRRTCPASHIRRGHPSRRVASIASLISAYRHGRLDLDTSAEWLVVIDEAHHVTPENQWGQLRQIFPRARFVGFTATPARMDGQSLHVDRGGIFDRLVQARQLGDNSTAALIERGYLAPFRVYSAPNTERRLDYGSGKLSIYGCPIEQYRRLAAGSQAILMAPAIRNASEFADQFRAAGIAAACISSEDSPGDIVRMLDAFAAGQIKVLTNVDMVGEGFDLPAVSTLIIATVTASYPRFRQWVGRVLRPAVGKIATIIDHTGMCAIHGEPDAPIRWDLLDPPVGPKSVLTCPCQACGFHFPVRLTACPECGAGSALLEREGIGQFYFDIRRLDAGALQLARDARQRATRSELLLTEISWPQYQDGSGLLGRTVGQIRRWHVDRLKDAGVPIIEINEWLRSPLAHDTMRWTRAFTVKDLQSKSTAKALKFFRCKSN